MMNLFDSSTQPAPHPRIVFPSVAIAHQASPFFIDEEQVGPWLSASDKKLQAKGSIFMTSRNAIHIPSLEQNGAQISAAVVAALCKKAGALGLNQFSNATGYWTLASSGALQTEKIKIAYSDHSISPSALYQLAHEVLQTANQEAVAIEISGRVEQYFGK